MRSACGLALLALITAFAPRNGRTQEAAKERVAVSCACTDSTGRLFAGALRDALARNPRYREVSAVPGSGKSAVRFSIVSLALDDDSHGESRGTALSIVFLNDGVMLDHLIETCDRSSVDVCARSTIASFDSIMNTKQLRASF